MAKHELDRFVSTKSISVAATIGLQRSLGLFKEGARTLLTTFFATVNTIAPFFNTLGVLSELIVGYCHVIMVRRMIPSLGIGCPHSSKGLSIFSLEHSYMSFPLASKITLSIRCQMNEEG